MSEVSTWNAVDASNNLTPPDGWPEGMQPSAVNDSARMMMGALRREHDRVTAQIGSVAGTINTTTINATTVTASGAIAGGTITGTTLNSTGNASVAGTLTAGQLTSTGNVSVSGNVTAAAVTGGYIHSTGSIDVAGNTATGTLTVSGNVTLLHDVAINGTLVAHGASFTNIFSTGALNVPYLLGGTDGSAGTSQTTTGHFITFRYDGSAAGGQVAWRINASVDRFIGSTVNVFNTYYNAAGGPTGVGFYGADAPGNVYINYVDALSDERIKDNISETSVDALTLLNQVEVSQFDVKGPVAAWIKTIGQDMPERIAAMRDAQPVHVPIGFVAQRLQPFVPEAVNTVRQDEQPAESPLPVDVMNVNKTEFVPYLVRAIQQLAARVEQLEAGGTNV